MNKLKNLSEEKFLTGFFACLSFAFVIAAFFMPDRGDLLAGLWRIWSQPGKISTNDFALGGYAATFLNMGLVGIYLLALMILLKAKPNNVTTFGFVLTLGFSSWGITVLNIWPTVAGVVLYCLVKKEKLGANFNAMLFSTGIAPLITDLLVRYPHPETVGFSLAGFGAAMAVGLFIGFMLPAGLAHAPNVHKGFDLYSAAVPVCFLAFFLNATLYKTMGIALPAVNSDMSVASRSIVNIFCIAVFGLSVAVAALMGCGPKEYWKLFDSSEHVGSVSGKLGNATFLMNFGLFGLFILAYYNCVHASFNAVTFGIIFCMVCTANSGSHPGNVWPIMMGYILTSAAFGWLSGMAGGEFAMTINAQAICVGVCFANGLSPVVSKYGWGWGIVAGGMHFLLVTSVPNMHGGYCLYNGGFTAAVIALLLVPVVERLVKTEVPTAEK